jgi:hypothetical protein
MSHYVKSEIRSLEVTKKFYYTNSCGPLINQADPIDRAVYGRSLTGIVSSNPAGGMDVCLL